VETLALAKNACDTVVAAFFEVNQARYRDAFHPQARSHFPITALSWVLGVGRFAQIPRHHQSGKKRLRRFGAFLKIVLL
jgi:hypothetical protein